MLYLEISSRGGARLRFQEIRGGKPSWMQNLLSDLVFQGGQEYSKGGVNAPLCPPINAPLHPIHKYMDLPGGNPQRITSICHVSTCINAFDLDGRYLSYCAVVSASYEYCYYRFVLCSVVWLFIAQFVY